MLRNTIVGRAAARPVNTFNSETATVLNP